MKKRIKEKNSKLKDQLWGTWVTQKDATIDIQTEESVVNAAATGKKRIEDYGYTFLNLENQTLLQAATAAFKCENQRKDFPLWYQKHKRTLTPSDFIPSITSQFHSLGMTCWYKTVEFMHSITEKTPNLG